MIYIVFDTEINKHLVSYISIELNGRRGVLNVLITDPSVLFNTPKPKPGTSAPAMRKDLSGERAIENPELPN